MIDPASVSLEIVECYYFKFERFSHLSDRSFGLGSLLLGLGTYHWCFHWESWCIAGKRYLVP